MNQLPKEIKILLEALDMADLSIIITSENGTIIYRNKKSSDMLYADATGIKKAKYTGGSFLFQNSGTNVRLIKTTEGNYFLYLITEDEEKNRLWNENNALRQIIDKSNDGIIFSDKDGYIRLYNAAHEEIDGYKTRDVLGKHLDEVYRIHNHAIVQQQKKPIETRFHYYATVDRDRIPLVTGTYPYIDPHNGEVFGVYSISQDLSYIRHLQRQVAKLQQEVAGKSYDNNTRYSFDDIIGRSLSIKAAVDKAKKYADSLAPIIICGETGTGKELFAQSIHNYSCNNEEPFVAINCGAIPDSLIESTLFGSEKGAFTGAEKKEGLFLSAKHGTLFLDEVNSMPLNMQTKLLRALQEKKIRPVGSNKEHSFQCRIISSCNADPEEAVREKTFRSDLYYRLAVIRLDIPPLKKREGDPILLAEHFAKNAAETYHKVFSGFNRDFIRFLDGYSWPGNIRELQMTIESCFALMDKNESVITTSHLPEHLSSKKIYTRRKLNPDAEQNLPEILAEYERTIITHALEDNNGNISKTARQLGILRQNLQQRIKKLSIKN